MNVAVITARGGSKRVPRKNVRPFRGRPLIAWPIRAALESCLFDRVLVSTEDAEIAAVSAEYGAEILPRPIELADDFSGTADVLDHALKTLDANGRAVDLCCCLYGTSYAVTPDLLREAFQHLADERVELVIAARRYPHPIERALILKPDGLAVYRQPEYVLCRSQDLPVSYQDMGLFYIFRAEAFLAHSSSFVPLARRLVEIPPLGFVDIDEPADWALAERLAELALA
jgi:N-acylneuraminate cytidylyltransferase